MTQELTAFTLDTRPLYFVLAGLLLLSLAIPALRRRLALRASALEGSNAVCTFVRNLTLSSVGLFLVCLISKYSQVRSHLVYGSDYWLFADMLHWMAAGKTFITRYVFFDLGPVQHGALHSFFSMYLLTPLAWIFGGGGAALAMNPIAYALAVFAISFIAFRWTNSRLIAVTAGASLLMANLMGRMFQYECHPETFYVALILGTAYLWEKKWSWKTAIGAVAILLTLTGLKQDGLFIGGAIGLWLLATNLRMLPKVALAAVLTVSCFSGMTWAIHHFGREAIGPKQVVIGTQSVDVGVISRGSVIVGNQKIASENAVRELVKMQIAKRGGVVEFALDVLAYPFRTPFVLIILMAPWVLLRRDFWVLVFPMALVFGVFSGPMSQLNSYYGASVMGLMCVAILADLRGSVSGSKKLLYAKLVWLFCFSAIHGSSGIPYYQPSAYSIAMDEEAEQISKTLDGLGVVSSSLLRVVDQEKIYSDHVEGGGKSIPDFVRWVLYPKFSESWDFKATRFDDWKTRALASGDWELVSGKNVDLLRRKR